MTLAALSLERLQDRLDAIHSAIAAHNIEVAELTFEKQQLQAEVRRRLVRPVNGFATTANQTEGAP